MSHFKAKNCWNKKAFTLFFEEIVFTIVHKECHNILF